MISIINKKNCCGCEACVQACPKQCISFKEDAEGFFYPEVNTNICVECGLCEKVCPVLHPNNERIPKEVFASINKNEKVRMTSSSGGMFSLLAEKVLNQGGIVFGVRFDENWNAVFDYAKDSKQVEDFRGSKYMQARVGNSFRECKKVLDQGKLVLFAGTPCQITALRNFLRKSYSNLLTVDFVCHGVPSPKVWRKYLEETIKNCKQSINKNCFFNKKWNDCGLTFDYNSQSKQISITSPFYKNPYSKAFLQNLILRPSCYSCPSKAGRSGSDITIADFWGVDKVCPTMDDDKGTSLILLYTEEGTKAIPLESLHWAKASYEDVLMYNSSIARSAIKHSLREVFFAVFSEEKNLNKLIAHCLRPTKKQLVKRLVKKTVRLVKHLLLCVLRVENCKRIYPAIPPFVIENMKVRSVQFRSKEHGWKNYELKITLLPDNNCRHQNG